MPRPRVPDNLVAKVDWFAEEHTEVPDAASLSFEDKLAMLLKAHQQEIGEPLGPRQRNASDAGIKNQLRGR